MFPQLIGIYVLVFPRARQIGDLVIAKTRTIIFGLGELVRKGLGRDSQIRLFSWEE